MNKYLVLFVTLLAIASVSISAMAQPLGAQRTVRARIRTMGVLGEGLAISPSDPMDFEVIKVAIASVNVVVFGEEKTVRIGVLHFGDQKYKIKDVEIGNASVSGNIYENETQVGSFSADSYVKGTKEIWAGSMTLDGENYNIYVIQAPRKAKPVEVAERAFEYCKNNPEKCRAAVKAVGKQICGETGNCADKIKNFCSQHPDDARCKALHRAYCATHLSDSTCREEMIKYCKEHPDRPACEKLAEVYNKNLKKRPNMINKAPEWFKRLRSRLKTATQLKSGKQTNATSAGGERGDKR
ncbi:MAG: hypothetical protein J7K72_00975 [Candidatus Aenigmarchaeota archaeon]|nr:hypothetical protein [Candidatus Aenigmarchaeota archaeon]